MFDNDLEAGGWLRVEEFRDADTFVIRAELPGTRSTKSEARTTGESHVALAPCSTDKRASSTREETLSLRKI